MACLNLEMPLKCSKPQSLGPFLEIEITKIDRDGRVRDRRTLTREEHARNGGKACSEEADGKTSLKQVDPTKTKGRLSSMQCLDPLRL